MTKFDDEIISGGTFRSIWKVAWPVIITQLIAGIHGIIDQALVGKHVGPDGQAAIGASWQLFLVIVVFISSLFHGMNIFIAQYVGRRDSAAVNRVAYQTFLSSAYVLILVVAPLGWLLSPYLLDLIAVPEQVHVYATPYLRFLFVFSMPLFLMFLLINALQSSGNTKIPMMLGLVTAIVHVLISWVLIQGVGPFPEMGVIGAAFGTVFGPLPSVALVIWLIVKGKTIVGPPEKFTLMPDFDIVKRVSALGLPAGTQAVLLNLGGAVLIYFINQLEHNAAALAAYTVCYAQLFAIVTWAGFGLRAACATVMGQNIGAGKLPRGERAVYLGAGIGLGWALFFGILFWTIPDALLGVFSLDTEPEVAAIARELLQFLTFSSVCVVVVLAFTGGLQSAGDTRTPMYIAFITQIVILLGLCFVFDRTGHLTARNIWMAILISHVTRLVLTYIVFAAGRWRTIKVSLDAPVAAVKAVETAEARQDAVREA